MDFRIFSCFRPCFRRRPCLSPFAGRLPQSRSSRALRGTSGFTLLEVVIAMTLSALVVMMAVSLYSAVQRAGTSIVSAQRTWVARQFLRGQLAHQDKTLNKQFSLVRLERDRLVFVSRQSVRYGQNGPPVVAFYRIDHGQLSYREVLLPPWWQLEDREGQFDLERLRSTRDAFEGVLFPVRSDATLSRWDESRSEWVEQWDSTTELPRAIRLVADATLVLETSSLDPRSRSEDK